MADLDKNIIITPNVGQSAAPNIRFLAANSSVNAQTITMTALTASDGTLLFTGNSGNLFSISSASPPGANVLTIAGSSVATGNLYFTTPTSNATGIIFSDGSILTTTSTTVLNDISNQFDNLKCVFNLAVDQANVINILDSKNVEVVVNGSRLSPYIRQNTYPWLATYDSYKGYRVVSTNTQSSLIIYNAPAPGDQATVTIINNSSTPQIRKYPFSAATIALGD